MTASASIRTDRHGRSIALEGRDGVGKTTVRPVLADMLRRRIGSGMVVETREPGGTPLGARLREELLHGQERPSSRAEVLLFAADNAQHAHDVVWPTLESGRWVLSDRGFGSALAYQGFGRGWGVEQIREIYGWAIDGCVPDLTLLLDCSDEIVKDRVRQQGGEPDNIEASGVLFHQRVRDGYRQLARSDERWVTIDCSGSVDRVAALCMEQISGRLLGD